MKWVERAARDERAYSVVSEARDICSSDRKGFWQQVSDILSEVFDLKSNQTELAIREMRVRMDMSSPDTQLFFYHARPFEIAADLRSEIMRDSPRPLSDDEKKRYKGFIAPIDSENRKSDLVVFDDRRGQGV